MASTSASTSSQMLDQDLALNGLTRYSLKPPSWRAPWFTPTDPTQEPIYPQFFPTSKGQDEDQLTETAVKIGFVGKTVVQSETFSAHQHIYEKLKGDSIMSNLQRLATAVADRAQSRVASYGPPASRLPSRVVVTEPRKEAWVNDLANPAVPLSKLSKNIPHGFRGEKLLEMLYTRQVPLLRAVWYIRAMGGVEIASKGKTGLVAAVAQYTSDWSSIIEEFVRKQLDEIVLPEPTPDLRPEASSRSKSKRVLVDGELRAKWTEKFTYTLRLVETLYEEQLLDRNSFLRFMVQQIESSNVGQLPFILFLTEEYLGEILQSEPLSATLVSACLSRLAEVSASEPTSLQSETTQSLTSLIRSTFISLPDAFVPHPIWSTYSKQIQGIMLAPGSSLSSPEDQLEKAVFETVRSDLADLKSRGQNQREELAIDGESAEPDELETIGILDDVVFPVDIASVHKALFHKRRRRRPLSVELPILFTWSTTRERFGSHRVYAVSTLIALEVHSISNAKGEKRCDVEKAFIDWVDALGGARGSEGEDDEDLVEQQAQEVLRAVRGLLEQLIRVGVVSYALYLQRMIARGDTVERGGASPSFHLQLLRTVPLFEETGTLLAKRRISLRNPSTSPKQEAGKRLNDKAVARLLKLVPALDDRPTKAPKVPPTTSALNFTTALALLREDGSHFALTREFIPKTVASVLQSHGTITPEDHTVLAQSFSLVQDMWGFFEYLVMILQNRPQRDLVVCLLDTIEQHLDTWTSMGALPTIGAALISSHESLRTTGVNDRRLIQFLRRLGRAGHLEASSFAQLESEFKELISLLSLPTSRPPPLPLDGIPELRAFAEGSSQTVATLASTVWHRYHSLESWGLFVLDSSIRIVPEVSMVDISSFLRQINERLPEGLEAEFVKWVPHMKPEVIVSTFGGKGSFYVQEILIDLVTDGTVSGACLISNVVLPSWTTLLHLAVPLLSSPPSPLDPVLFIALEMITAIFRRLVLPGDGSMHLTMETMVSISSLVENNRALSRSATIYTRINLPDLGRCLARLIIQQELWDATGDSSKAAESGRLFASVSQSAPYQRVVTRDPQVLATAMLEDEFILQEKMRCYRAKLLAAFLTTLKKDGSAATPANLVSTEGWDLFLSGLTIWRLAVSKVEVQACLERLEIDDELNDSEKSDALHTLSRHFLDKVCLGEGHMYLGEQVVRCYHGRASDELVSVAFTRLAVALDGISGSASPELQAQSMTALRCTLRLLNTLLQSGSASSRPEPLQLLMGAVKSRLDALIALTSSPDQESLSHAAELLMIALKCTPVKVGPELSEIFMDCLVRCAQLAAIQAKYQSHEIETTLLDTCSHLLFRLKKMAPSLCLPTVHSLSNAELDLDPLPDATFGRLTRLFGPQSTRPIQANPWELIDHADPGPLKETRHNNEPIDLALFDAKIVQAIPLVTALDVVPPSPATTNSSVSERGLQTNFDFETPCVGLSLEARDYRRTLRGGKIITSRYDPAAVKLAEVITATSVSALRTASTSSTTSSAPAPLGKGKRKDAEVIIISDDDIPAPTTRAPPAKRARGATAGKTTGRGRGGKKPK